MPVPQHSVFLICKYFLGISIFMAMSCNGTKNKEEAATKTIQVTHNEQESPLVVKQPDSLKTPHNMVWVSGIHFTMGAQSGDKQALPREKPAHPVAVDGFFIDKTEVTNDQFQKFVNATGYLTTAEKPVDWEEMKKQLPTGTPKPADSVLMPGSLIFREDVKQVQNLNDYSQWWEWKNGADWKHPQGPDSSIKGKGNYPVVQVSYDDAVAYCKWANRSLPTEAQWEAAAHGKLTGGIYTWGDDADLLTKEANTWQGTFPVKNTDADGYDGIAPVKSYDPNSLGIYDMAGNVWELTQDWFNLNYYKNALAQGEIRNPKGASEAYNPEMSHQQEKIIKGGSFLCAASYCASYRISARMGNTMDSATDHTGFRTVAAVGMPEQ